MVKIRRKIPAFCFKISKARIRVRSPPLQSNPTYNSIKSSRRSEYCDDCESSFTSDTPRSSDESSESSEVKDGNRIMVVVDTTQEAKGALQWALSHTVQKEDTVILLYIAKPSKKGSVSEDTINTKAYGILYTLKSVCQTRRPGVQVEVVAQAGKDKGRIIVETAKEQKASLLVLGHRKRSVAWRFLMRWTGSRGSHCVVDYCIQNADCMTIAVRRKSRKVGGYLITTKRHKNFWLLA